MASQIPDGSSIVEISIISPNRVLNVPPNEFLTPEIRGTSYSDTPCLSFLVEHHDAHGKLSRLIFDLGIRADWTNLPPAVVSAVQSMNIQIVPQPDIPDCLIAHEIDLASIQHIVFSHWHFDHVGDATRFPSTCDIIVGPGFTEHCLPGYPTDPDSLICEDAFQNRQLHELKFDDPTLTIAGLSAIDWFGDGSFYLLHTPGHAVGHISGLARTTLGNAADGSSDTFILLAGDVCHHAGELRPTRLQPIPSTFPLRQGVMEHYKTPAEYEQLHPCCCRDQPFYQPSAGGFNLDVEMMQATVEKVALLDADPVVFTVLAHDHWLLNVIELFPAKANEWKAKGWADASRWRFLQDFT